MKIILLGDTHLGIRNDAKHFHEYYEKFYSSVFFPYLEKHAVSTIIQLGDLFDRRKYINFLSLAESRRYFFDECKKRNIHLHALVGNHDIFWRHSLSVSSPRLLLNDYDNITLWDKHGTLEIDDAVFDMIPWICNENEKEILEFISKVIFEVIYLLLEEFLFKDQQLTETQRSRRLTMIPLFRSLLQYLIYFAVAVSILYILDINPTPILAGAGIIGLAVGLGAQTLINDIVSGFFILFENYYLVGEYIQAGKAEEITVECTVESID